jgi:hypothetical protein
VDAARERRGSPSLEGSAAIRGKLSLDIWGCVAGRLRDLGIHWFRRITRIV